MAGEDATVIALVATMLVASIARGPLQGTIGRCEVILSDPVTAL